MTRDIKEKLFEIDSKKIELDFLQQQFLIECKRFCAHTIENIVRTAISANYQTVIKLDTAGLKPVKKEINKIIENISEIVDKTVRNDELWLHTSETLNSDKFPIDHYIVSESHVPDILELPVKQVFSPIGKILVAHKLDSNKNWENKNREKLDINHSLLYRHPLVWSKEMIHSIEQYNERFNELSQLIQEYKILSGQNPGKKALDLWDEI